MKIIKIFISFNLFFAITACSALAPAVGCETPEQCVSTQSTDEFRKELYKDSKQYRKKLRGEKIHNDEHFVDEH